MIRVRAAKVEDVPRLLEIASHSATAARWNETEYGKLFASNTPPGLVALVIEEDALVQGLLAGRRLAETEWEIENVAVSAPARRRGLGTHLMGAFLKLVRESGGREVFLEMRESNHAARALYEKWAFIECGRRRNYYRSPDEDALVLKFSFPNPV